MRNKSIFPFNIIFGSLIKYLDGLEDAKYNLSKDQLTLISLKSFLIY